MFSDLAAGNARIGSIDVQNLMLAGQNVNDRLNRLEAAASSAAQLGSRVDGLDSHVSTLDSHVASLEADLAFYASASAMLNGGKFGGHSMQVLQLN